MVTERIELGDGDYVLAFKDLLRKTARQVQQAYRKYMKPRGKPVLLSEIGTADLLNDYEVDTASVDQYEITEIFILNQVTEWSYGAINHDTIENMPDVKYQLLQKELNRLYTPSPLVEKT
jgi:hypothetical protein